MSEKFESKGYLKSIAIEEIKPWEIQPRKFFEVEKMRELVESVRLYGVIQPLVVRPFGEVYQIVAGERRWRAAKQCGKEELLCVVRDLSDKEALELGLVENLVRSDLDLFEEGESYRRLVNMGYSVVDLSEKFSRSRQHIYNRMELLELDDEAQHAIREDVISMGVARELLRVPADQRGRALKEILHPDYQVDALSRDQAMKYLREKYVTPARLEEFWTRDREALQAQFPSQEVCEWAEGILRKQKGSGYVFLEDFPKHFECVERLQKSPHEIPSWGDLVDRFEAWICIVPGASDDDILRMVSRELILEADKTLSSEEDRVFLHGRKLHVTVPEPTSKELCQQQIKQLFEDLKTSGIEGSIEQITRDRAKVGFYNSLANYYEIEEGKVEKFAVSYVKSHGLRGYLWLDLVSRIDSKSLLVTTELIQAVGLRPDDYSLILEGGWNEEVL